MSEHDKPVGLFSKFSDGIWKEVMPGSGGAIPLYTHPAQWVGLTDEDVSLLDWESFKTKKECVQAIEALLREKNT